MTDRYLFTLGESETFWHSSLSFRVKERAPSKNKEYLEFGGIALKRVNISGKNALTKTTALIAEVEQTTQRKSIVFMNTALSVCTLTISKPSQRELREKGYVVISANTLGLPVPVNAKGVYKFDDVKKLGDIITTYVNKTYKT